MKKINLWTTITLLILITLGGCKNSTTDTQPTEISSDEKEIIKKEISSRIEEIIIGAKELDVEAAIRPYSSDSDFIVVNPDASVSDFQTMKRVQAEGFNTLKSLNFSTVRQDFTFLAKDLVMCTWTGRNEFELKTGEKMKIEPYVGSMLFRKTDNDWRIIYAHETSAPPVTIE